MKISVIIPAYNSEAVLMDAVQSVCNQTYLSYICEIVIVNDGSKDQTAKVMQQIAKQVTQVPITLINKENGGASSARNAGIKAASGDWIALLDADDEWLANKLERQVQTLQEHPEIDFLGCGSDDRTLRILFHKVTKLYHASVRDLCIKSFPVTPSILFRKKIVDTIGYFDEHKKYMEDADFCLRVAEKFQYYYLPESLVRTGHGKKAMGASGLSANVKGLYLGMVQNLKDAHQRGSISTGFYGMLRIFSYMKYIRRCILTKLGK